MKRHTFLILLFFIAILSNARDVKTFNDGWLFKKGPFGNNRAVLTSDALSGNWTDVTLPHTWNAKDMQTALGNMTGIRNPQERFYTGEAFYKKLYTPSKADEGKRVFLKFEGVGSVADVYVNNTFAGSHKGAYSAFTDRKSVV